MFLITCPVTRTDELVADRRIRSVTNHPTHIAMHVECPACGGVHAYRTGRRLEAPPADRRRTSSRPRIEHMSESPLADQTLEKDPADWVTGDEPATGAQKSYLETLTRATDEDVPEDLTKAEASKKIDDLKS